MDHGVAQRGFLLVLAETREKKVITKPDRHQAAKANRAALALAPETKQKESELTQAAMG